jgi:hypothetical protein
MVSQLVMTAAPAFCLEGSAEAPANQFSNQYTDVTKKILLAGIQLERFSLNYRQESVKQPKFRRIRYFLAQEAGAGGELGFEVTGDVQFNKGRKRPLQISMGALRGSLIGAFVGSVIGGAGSGVELTSNAMLAMKNHRNGFSPREADKFVVGKLKEIDTLLSERERIVSSNADLPTHERAVLEGEILKQLRNAFLDEYSHFHADARGFATATNTFYTINVATSVVGSTASVIAFHGVRNPHQNGAANVLFIVAGAMDMVNPLISSAVAKIVVSRDHKKFKDEVGGSEQFDYARLAAARARLAATASVNTGSLMPAFPVVDRMAVYEESGDLFRKQIDNETAWARHFGKVALQSSLFGPIVGGGLMTQGILGTAGYYKYPLRPRKQLALFHDGAIIGTGAAGIAVVGTAGQLLASYSYENHLRKKGMLPEQLIKARLDHLNELEKSISAVN